MHNVDGTWTHTRKAAFTLRYENWFMCSGYFTRCINLLEWKIQKYFLCKSTTRDTCFLTTYHHHHPCSLPPNPHYHHNYPPSPTLLTTTHPNQPRSSRVWAIGLWGRTTSLRLPTPRSQGRMRNTVALCEIVMMTSTWATPSPQNARCWRPQRTAPSGSVWPQVRCWRKG